jgi:hypothetical protein
MYHLIKKYSLENPERFNKDFILSRNDQDVLKYIKDIFKSLEILNEIEVLDVRLETDESQFIPIKNKHQYYKSILPSRLNKIHYEIRITPSERTENIPILDDEEVKVSVTEGSEIDSTTEIVNETSGSFIIKKDLFINKLIDNSFYINEGIRYFLIYQIVDNSTYGTKDAVSLKSLLMPITVMQKEEVIASSVFDSTKNYAFKSFDVMLFSKKVNPILYVMNNFAYNSLIKLDIQNQDKKIEERQNHKDKTIIKKFNTFFKTDIKFGSKDSDMMENGRTVFKISEKVNDKGEKEYLYISVDTKSLKDKDENLMAVIGSLMNIRSEVKKKKINFSYEDFVTPWFWVDKLSSFFTKNNDPEKKFEKIKTMLISLDRLMDDATRKILNLSKEDKKNTLSVIYYIMRNFDKLSKEDNQDLNNKRIRLYEYQLYPLRKYFSDQIYRVLNSPTRSRNVLERIFSNLGPMYIIKQTVVNELLRYYNSTNEMNLYSCLLKYTFRGPQSINKTVSVYQRDLHPSYTGRLSLVASSASDPGISGTLVPFVQLDNYYFAEQNKDKKEG